MGQGMPACLSKKKIASVVWVLHLNSAEAYWYRQEIYNSEWYVPDVVVMLAPTKFNLDIYITVLLLFLHT
uniref:Uncharacterized protein n=1 Tax=Setaria italica TaxID=4555 RepID=K3XQJ6_SETIT